MRHLRPALPILLQLALLVCAIGLAQESFAQSRSAVKKRAHATRSSGTRAASTSHRTVAHHAHAARSKSSFSAAGVRAHTVKASSKTDRSPKRGRRSSRRSRRQIGQKTPTGERISEIQTALAKDGSFQGAPNGRWDDDTAAAMRKFQAAHGLNPTGKLDALSLQKLGLGSQTAGVAPPTPPPGAVSRLTSSNASSASVETARRQ